MQNLPSTFWRFFWHFIKKWPISFALFFLTPCILILNVTVIPYSLKLIIDATEQHLSSRELIVPAITPALWMLAIAWLSILILARAQNWWQGYIIPKFEADIRMSVMEYLTHHSYQYFSNNLSGQLATKVNNLPRTMDSIRMIISWNIIATISIALASLIMVYTVAPIFAYIMFVWIAVTSSISYYLSFYVQRAAIENANDYTILSGKIVDIISNIISVKLFASRGTELTYLHKTQDLEATSNKTLIITLNFLRITVEITSVLMLGFTLYYLVTSWQDGKISSGDFALIFNISFALMDQLWYLGQALADLAKDIGTAKQALELVNRPHGIKDKENAQQLKVTRGLIEFENVTFSYKNNGNIFTDTNLIIEAGQKVGLVGFSGSGKTTFVNLILRFFDINSGAIKIDGQSIAEVTQDSLRRNITVIPQDTSLFHRSLFENIHYGNIEASDEEVYEASKMAHCHEFIQKLKDGYQSLVGERGVKLSGGQRQRIAIARAILKQSPILILDEATSALDSLTEKYIQESLKILMEKKTTIVIAHRLSTLAAMNRILVFDKGHIVEDGTHDQLIRKNSHYKKLWTMQAGGFLPEQDVEG